MVILRGPNREDGAGNNGVRGRGEEEEGERGGEAKIGKQRARGGEGTRLGSAEVGTASGQGEAMGKEPRRGQTMPRATIDLFDLRKVL